jgi:ferredoxin
VCPVDCFHEGVNFLAIDPEVCIDCGLCPPECPTSAIFAEEDLPEKWHAFIEINARLAPKWPVIDSQKEPLPEADEFAKVESKKDLLDQNAFGG